MDKFKIINKLLNKGVYISDPSTVIIGSEINIDRISGNGVKIYSGCKIFGSSTLISSGAQLGIKGNVTIKNCKLDKNVNLQGGYFEDSVFLKRSKAGPGSYVRSGTILEEYSSIAHTVGLKHTILFPFVTIGSLVNFCNCFMSGGTSKKNHSEVGSSFIHFNYTPNQDKATPSMLGDIPNGVMLNQKPIFLGGHGGIVGPCRIKFGTILGAGSICRKDKLKEKTLVFDRIYFDNNNYYAKKKYGSIKRQIFNNVVYIANLLALAYWYKHIRSKFINDNFSKLLIKSLVEVLDFIIMKQAAQFDFFCKELNILFNSNEKIVFNNKLMHKIEKKNNIQNTNSISNTTKLFLEQLNSGYRINENFISIIENKIYQNGYDYIHVISNLEKDIVNIGTSWLQSITDEVVNALLKLFSNVKKKGIYNGRFFWN